jgi:hypothetical protein
MTNHYPDRRSGQVSKAMGLLTLIIIGVATLSVQAQDLGHAQGKLIANGEPFEFKHAYVYFEDNPLEDGETGTVIKLTTNAVDIRDLGQATSGGNTISVHLDQAGKVYSRNVNLRAKTGFVSASGLPFDFDLQKSESNEYRGSLSGKVDSVNDIYEFSLKFAAVHKAVEPGTPLPADGGEPGKTYMARFELLNSGDWDQISKAMPAEQLEGMRASGLSDEELLGYLTLGLASEIKIIGGTLDALGDRAYLEATRVKEGQSGTGTITMVLDHGKWERMGESWK